MQLLIAIFTSAAALLLVNQSAAHSDDEWLPLSNFQSSAPIVRPYSGPDAVKCCSGITASLASISSSSTFDSPVTQPQNYKNPSIEATSATSAVSITASITVCSQTTVSPIVSSTSTTLPATNLAYQLTTHSNVPFTTSTCSSNPIRQSFPKRAAEPRYRGFNVVNQSPADPYKFKNTTEWAEAFRHIRSFPGDLNAARLYSTTDGSTKHLLNALPAAKSENISLFVGVWSGGDINTKRFDDEKQALDDALTQFGCDNIIAVSVGNEDMYNDHRTDDRSAPLTDIMLLVDQTQQVMHVLDEHGCCGVKVTHTDTFGDWLKTNKSEPLIRQVDFLTVNIFPYWEGQHINDAGQAFWQQVNETKYMAAGYGKDIWIGETGWPMRGDSFGKAEANVDFMHMYWNQVGCNLMSNMSAFWYVEWDANTIPSFGMMDANGRLMVDVHSC